MPYKTNQKPFPRRKCEKCGSIFRPWFEYGQTLCYKCDKRSLLDRWAGPNENVGIEIKEGNENAEK